MPVASDMLVARDTAVRDTAVRDDSGERCQRSEPRQRPETRHCPEIQRRGIYSGQGYASQWLEIDTPAARYARNQRYDSGERYASARDIPAA